MNIGIFLVMAGREAGGPETYEISLVRHLARLDSKNNYHIYCLDNSAPASLNIQQDNFNIHTFAIKSRWISVPFSLPLAMYRDDIGLVHNTFIPPPFSSKDYVFTMHSSVHFVHPEFYPARIRLRLNSSIKKGISKAKNIICVSNNVRDLTAEYYGVSADRLSVIYHGVDPMYKPLNTDNTIASPEDRYQINGPYILVVGKIQKNKNIIRILEAFYKLKQDPQISPELKLVLAGKRTWTSEGIDEAISGYKLQKDVIELGHLPHAELPALYNGAQLLAFPTLWEGFGLPALESMACGTPVVTSNNSCMPEITNGAAIMIDPYSSDSLASGMHEVLTDENTAMKLRDSGLKRAAEFTWEKTAQQTLDVYQNVYNG